MTNDFKPAKAGGNQPRLSKEEYAEKKRAEKEKVYQMIDDAAREIVNDPEKFKSFLDTQSRMGIFLGQKQSMAVILMPMQWSFPLSRHKGLVGTVMEIPNIRLMF